MKDSSLHKQVVDGRGLLEFSWNAFPTGRVLDIPAMLVQRVELGQVTLQLVL